MCETVEKSVPAWTACDMCEEYICNIHDRHVSDCDCPAIDTWVLGGYFPYDSLVDDKLRNWVEANPFEEE